MGGEERTEQEWRGGRKGVGEGKRRELRRGEDKRGEERRRRMKQENRS